MQKKSTDPDYWCSFERLIIPLIDAILTYSSKFRIRIIFNSDTHRLMAANNLQNLENLEHYFGVNIDNINITNINTQNGST